MNSKIVTTILVAGLLLAGGLFYARAEAPGKTTLDPRIDKLIEQNEKILKNQDQILKALGDLQTGIAQLRRRSS